MRPHIVSAALGLALLLAAGTASAESPGTPTESDIGKALAPKSRGLPTMGTLPPAPEQLQTARAVEVLEHIGTREALQCLETLTKGAPEARLTQEAKSALERLLKQDSSSRHSRP